MCKTEPIHHLRNRCRFSFRVNIIFLMRFLLSHSEAQHGPSPRSTGQPNSELISLPSAVCSPTAQGFPLAVPQGNEAAQVRQRHQRQPQGLCPVLLAQAAPSLRWKPSEAAAPRAARQCRREAQRQIFVLRKPDKKTRCCLTRLHSGLGRPRSARRDSLPARTCPVL